MAQRVGSTNTNYSKFKGDLIAVSEPIINKDLLVLKLDRAQRHKEKLDALLAGLADQEGGVRANTNNLQVLKRKYENFEKTLFQKKFSDTKYVIKDTAQLIEKIQTQQDNLSREAAKARQGIEGIAPSNQDQRAKLRKVLSDIHQVEKKVEASVRVIEAESKEFERLEQGHQQCEEVLSKLGPTDLAAMVAQSRQMSHFVENHKAWVELNKRLKALNDEDIGTCMFDLQRALADSKKFMDGVRGARKEEYDDLLRQIQKAGKKVGEDADEQGRRLDDFEAKLLGPDGTSDHVADADLVFLKREIARYRQALLTAEANKDNVLRSAQQINDEVMRGLKHGAYREDDSEGDERSGAGGIDPEDVAQLRQYLKALEKLQGNDIPRVKRNIDQLEAFSLKALKNRLNDDNKKSQGQISKMKKNYEDLQKQIEALNAKIGRVQGQVDTLKEQFTNEDLERENEIAASLDEKLAECDRDVNGEREGREARERADRGGRPGSEPEKLDKLGSLQARKKAIIANINKMVNQFNENNKLIKESNKVPKTEQEMADLIRRNREIGGDCKKIDDMINAGKEFAADIDERLDALLDPAIPDIKDKYTEKNQAIDECDELFEKANTQIDRLDNVVATQIAKLDDIIARLDSVNPINNPTPAGKDNADFLDDVSNQLDKAHALRDDLEKMRERLGNTRDKLINIV